jgi:hypothetical protein
MRKNEDIAKDNRGSAPASTSKSFPLMPHTSPTHEPALATSLSSPSAQVPPQWTAPYDEPLSSRTPKTGSPHRLGTVDVLPASPRHWLAGTARPPQPWAPPLLWHGLPTCIQPAQQLGQARSH